MTRRKSTTLWDDPQKGKPLIDVLAPVKNNRPTSINLYMQGHDIDRLDALATTLDGSRSDAIRHLLDMHETKPNARTAKETR